MNNLIAVTIGDINGIGIELLIRLWKKNKMNSKFVLFTNINIFNNYLEKKKININLNLVNKNKNSIKYNKNHFNIYSYTSKSNIENTYNSIKLAHRECIEGKFIGIITLPIRKELIIKNINSKFIGHTEFFQSLERKKHSNMIFIHNKIIISTLTTHISINKINKFIKKKNFIYNQILNLNRSLILDLNIKKPKILISGLNPHAGENGNIGNEEIKYIKPILTKLRKKNIFIDGPISGDSMLIKNNIKKYDCFLFIFHDQALIPFKFISNFSGVNFTGNLEVIRTSPDHGTAYNLIGSNKVSDKSLVNCFKLVNKINNNKKYNEKSKKITKSKFY